MAILLCALRRMENAWTQREYEESNFALPIIRIFLLNLQRILCQENMVLCASMIEIWVWIQYGQLFMMLKNKRIFRAEGNPSRKKFVEDSRMKFI